METEARVAQGLCQRIRVGQTAIPQSLAAYDDVNNVIVPADHPLSDLMASWRDPLCKKIMAY